MSVNKFKVGDVVKCVDSEVFINLTVGREYSLVDVCENDMVRVKNDKGICCYYDSCRFELSGVNAQQTPKFKEGDMVYLVGFDCLKPCKLIPIVNKQFEVETHNGIVHMFTENGLYTEEDLAPSIVLATEDNRVTLNKLLGVEYEPVKLTGSDLAKKLLKHKPQTCYVSDVSEEYATSNSGVSLIMGFENDSFISKSGTGWKFAVPCNEHGTVLEDE